MYFTGKKEEVSHKLLPIWVFSKKPFANKAIVNPFSTLPIFLIKTLILKWWWNCIQYFTSILWLHKPLITYGGLKEALTRYISILFFCYKNYNFNCKSHVTNVQLHGSMAVGIYTCTWAGVNDRLQTLEQISGAN